MSKNSEVICRSVFNWAVHVSAIGSIAPFPLTNFEFGRNNTCNLSVFLTHSSHSIMKNSVIVISDVLFGSSSDSIVVLKKTHSIHQFFFGINITRDFLSGSFSINHSPNEKLIARMEKSLAISNETFSVSSRCEIACPVICILVSIWEHIIILSWPLNILSNQLL